MGLSVVTDIYVEKSSPYDYYEEQFPNPQVSSLAKNVFESTVLNTTDNRYHETDGSTYYDSPINVLILQHNAGAIRPDA
jgi:hypothetical protein